MIGGTEVIAPIEDVLPSASKAVKTVNSNHRYSVKVEDVVAEHIKYSRQQSDDSEWKIVEDDGEMKVFIRETEMDGVTCDPIKATMVVDGISSLEICSAFYVPEFRMLLGNNAGLINCHRNP